MLKILFVLWELHGTSADPVLIDFLGNVGKTSTRTNIVALMQMLSNFIVFDTRD